MFRPLRLCIPPLAAFLALLAGCGNQPSPVASPAPTVGGRAAPAATVPPPSAAPAVTSPPAVATTGPSPAEQAQPTPAPPATREAGIAQGVTVEGYHFLGREDAPVTLQFFSDFF